MRVLLTTDTVGGVWTFTAELATGLLARGHAVAIISLGQLPTHSQQSWVLATSFTYGRGFHYEALDVPLEWMQLNLMAYADAEATLLGLVSDFQADVIHSSQFCFGALPTDVPKVITAHSDVLSWAEACVPGGLEDSDWLQRYRRLVLAGIRGAQLVVAPTRWMRDALAKHFPIESETLVIPNGRTVPSAKTPPTRRLCAVSVGRTWDPAKGLAVLEGIAPGIPVFVAGQAAFEDQGQQLPGSVEFLGSLEEGGVFELLRSSSLYLAASIYEPFGLAALEAALCGCGVVARDIPSLREVWGDAAAYFTDGETLSRLLVYLRDAPRHLEALQSRSLTRALTFSADRMVESYLRGYEMLLERHNVPVEALVHAS